MLFFKNFRRSLAIAVLISPTFIATVHAQEANIHLPGKKISAGAAMRSVEEQTDYRFSYNRNSYDTTRTVTLSDSSVALKALLNSMVAGIEINYMIRGRHIALIPSNDNSCPQVHREPMHSRTSDIYVSNRANGTGGPSTQIPAAATADTVPETAAEPEIEQYSDYRPIDIYGGVQTSLPRFGIRVNLLYGASLTPNISAEVALSAHSTLALTYSNNPWKYKADLSDNRKFLHGIVGLEYRYWFCERYSGHFFGARALYSEYNISGHNVPTLFKKDYRYKGNAYGGGAFYGYALPVGKMWNVEFTAGLNVLRMDYGRYGCQTCDTNREPFKEIRLAPSAGINLVFLIK